MPVLSLSTGSLYTYGIARAFDLAAEAGFDAMEVLVDHRWDTRQPAYLRRLSRDSGLPIAAVHNPFVPHVPGWPRDPQQRLVDSAALARELGARVVVAHLPLRIWGVRVELLGFGTSSLLLPIPLPNERGYRQFLLDDLPQFEKAAGVWVGVENMPAKRILGWRVSLWALNRVSVLERMPHLTLDTTHLGTWGLDPLAVYERLKGRIVHVHLSNFNGREHRLVEDGHLPLGELLQRLQGDGYQGAVSLELAPDALQAEDEGQVRAHLRRMVAFCREQMSVGQGSD
jgi:sugar phosphate isomerase/epimerase